MNVKIIDEQTLIQKAQIFDEESLSKIYDAYSPGLYRYAMRFLENQQFAEDCVSDTFLGFLKMLRAGNQSIDHLQPYLFRIAHNWITDFYRKKQIEIGEKEEIAAQDLSVPDQVERNIRTDQVRQVILSLPPEHQQVIVLKFLEGWENDEIAQLLNKNNGSIRALIFRAVNNLRKRISVLEKTDVF